MAKRSDAPEKRGGILGFFDSIKEFFQNLFDKIRIALEFHRRVEDGKKYWDTSPEGQAQREALEKDKQFGFRTLEQHREDQVHFPGYHEMQMSESGLLRIPKHTELLWQEATPEALAQRYIACMNERFAERPNPIESHDARAFGEIAQTMRRALTREDTSLHQFVLGDCHIVSQVEDGKINLSISNGTTTQMFTGKAPGEITDLLTSSYTTITNPQQSVIYINAHNETKSICRPTQPGSTEYDTFTAHAVTNWTNQGKNRVAYHIPQVREITGTSLADRSIVDNMINSHIPPSNIARYDLQFVMRRAYTQATESNGHSSVFTVGDKMLWATSHDGVVTFNITSYASKYAIAPVTLSVNEPYHMNTTEGEQKNIWMVDKEGKPKFYDIADVTMDVFRVVDQRAEMATMLQIVEFAQGLHPTTDDLADIAQTCADKHGQENPNGMLASYAELHTDGHTLCMIGYASLDPNGRPCFDTEIEFDGKCLYHQRPTQEYDDTVTFESKGMFTTREEALQYITQQTQGAVWTRAQMGLPVEKLVKLPQELRDQLPKEYQDVIAEYEAPSEFDDVVPDTGDMEVEETL